MNQQNETKAVQTPAEAQSGIIEVGSIEEFAHYLTGWHSTKVAELRHMLDMPSGVEMIIEEGGVEKTVLMEGPMLAGFKAGVELALMQLGTLPFGVDLEDGTTH